MSEEERPSPSGAFFLPEEGEADPRPIVRRLVEECPEFNHLRIGEAVIMVVMRTETKVKGNRQVLGEMALPRFQGSMGGFATWLLAKTCGGVLPDFILTLDATFWKATTPLRREALIYHELCHCAHALDKEGEPKFTDEGLPVWAIQGHDIEEFNATVRRYGAWLDDVEGFIGALRAGGAI